MKYVLALALLFARPDDEPIKVGIVGLDTSHVVAFTQLLNDPKSASHVPGARVVCAFKGGSADIESSASRVEGFTKTPQEKWGVEIVKFFKTGETPVAVEEMLEVLAFMEGADVSKAKGGAEVRLDELK